MGATPGPFRIKDCALITLATGKRAQNLRELRERIEEVPASSIYHHFHEAVLRASFDDPEYRNDFALWARRQLRDIVLSERLAAIDPFDLPETEDLRRALIEVIEERLSESAYIPWVPAGEEFHFLRSQVVVFDTGFAAAKPVELARRIPHLPTGSIFYHFIEARRREPIGEDDFSAWLRGFGARYESLCEGLSKIDYYFWSLVELRKRVAACFRARRREEP